MSDADLTLVVRRTIRASAEFLFAAWTEPDRLRQWWGPEPVVCDHAEIDLREGGAYRISNRFPDGAVVWISGEFERIEAPRLLVYSWRVDSGARSRVTVRFEPRAEATEIVVVHERSPSVEERDRHALGWDGCFKRLIAYAEGA